MPWWLVTEASKGWLVSIGPARGTTSVKPSGVTPTVNVSIIAGEVVLISQMA
jgi:hypothetical protein